jgi:NADPH:quinone reductase-like Zn-dependent oxidoreductase
MRAVRIHDFGGPDVMRIEEVLQTSPDSDEVLIKVLAARVIPVDAKIREGKYPPITPADLPYALGRDAAGEFVAIGDKVKGYTVGELIYVFLDPKRGGYQETVLAHVSEIAYQPATLDAVQAAGVPLNRSGAESRHEAEDDTATNSRTMRIVGRCDISRRAASL